MKKFLLLIGIVALGLVCFAFSCEDDTTDDEGNTSDNGNAPVVVIPDNVVPDNNKTEDNQTDNNKTEDNKTDDNQSDNNKTEDNQTDNNKTDDNQSDNKPEVQGFTEAEIAQANTAAGISSLSQMEKDIIFYCNLARLDGTKFWVAYGNQATGSDAYVSSLETDLKATSGLAMLQPEKSLMEAAAYHANDMSTNNFFDHTSSDGTSFGNRVYSFYGGNAIAENISAGMGTALGVVLQLLVDDGLPRLGHRKNILGANYKAIGVKTATHKTWRTVTVQDFGDKVITRME